MKTRATWYTSRGAIGVALALGLWMSACGKPKKESKTRKEAAAAKTPAPKVAPVAKPKPAAPKPPSPKDTWAMSMKSAVAEIQADLTRCRNEFMLPFQFNRMRRRDVTWVSLGEMDSVCRDGTKKKRGVYKRVVWLSKEHIGKSPALDRWISLAMDLSEHFRLLSIMTKKIGAPKIGLITDSAKAARDRVIAASMLMDKEAKIIAAWPDDMKTADDPQALSGKVSSADFKAELAARYDFFMRDAVDAYRRYASQSWKYPLMVKYKSYRLWPQLSIRMLQRDRARLGQVEGLDDKSKKAYERYFKSIEGVVEAWRASNQRYVKDRKVDTWTDKDPFEKGLIKAQKAWVKERDKFIGKAKK